MILLSIHCDTIREKSDKGDDCGLKIDEPNNTMEIGPSRKELLATCYLLLAQPKQSPNNKGRGLQNLKTVWLDKDSRARVEKTLPHC